MKPELWKDIQITLLGKTIGGVQHINCTKTKLPRKLKKKNKKEGKVMFGTLTFMPCPIQQIQVNLGFSIPKEQQLE